LREIHGKEVIHCDVKPANVLIQFGYTGSIKMRVAFCDFGLAQIGPSQGRVVKGTDTYTDPVILRSGLITYQSDMWSLGITILKLIMPDVDWTFLTRNAVKVLAENK
jgi:serine/threonine protein kinase